MPGLRVASEPRFEVEPAAARSVVLRLQAPREAIAPGSTRVDLKIQSEDDATIQVSEKTAFLGMRR